MANVLTCAGLGWETSDIMSVMYRRFAQTGGNTYIRVPFFSLSSIPAAADILDAQINSHTPPMIVLAHSRGCQIATHWIADHQNDPDRPAASDLSFILCGNPNRKYGGRASSVWPVNGVTTYAPSSNNGGWTVTDVARDGDGWCNWPGTANGIQNPFNTNGLSLPALATAVIGMFTTHLLYLSTPDLTDLEATKLDSLTENQTTYYLMP